jgi:pimeloyl-ACP methyl ester carboxylesterase
MSEPNPFLREPIDVLSGDPPVHLELYHYLPERIDKSREPRKPVLLLHGASASHHTFITPNAEGGLAAWLAEQNFDPWLLNWRGSGRVVDNEDNHDSLRTRGNLYNFNVAAEHDIPAAITAMRGKGVEGKLAVLGFCMGGAILAESVALRHINKTDNQQDVDCIVLMTLGLFYEATIDGRVKCEDRILEQLEQKIREGAKLEPWIDPRMAENTLDLRTPWHEDLDNLYKAWPGALKSHAELPPAKDAPVSNADAVNRMCNRLSFMYGMPYHHLNLVSDIHGKDGTDGLLPTLFGAIPLHMFIHGAQNIRKGHATFYERRAKGPKEEDPFLSRAAHENFRRLSKVTLITGALDRLWHRNSIDLMHEWLCRGTPEHLRKFRKHVIPDYAHQDLLWGEHSKQSIFPKIKAGFEAGSYGDRAFSAS